MFSALLPGLLVIVILLNLLLLYKLSTRESPAGAAEAAALEARLRDEIVRTRQQQGEDSRALREELAAGLQRFAGQTDQRAEALRSGVTSQLVEMQRDQRTELENTRTSVDRRLLSLQSGNEQKLEQMRQTVDEKLQVTLDGRLEELAAGMLRFTVQTDQRAEALRAAVTAQLADMHRDQRKELENTRTTVDQRLLALQTGNEQKLEQMRQTVDEKLQATLETRLGESFRLVSERLEQVHKGLGEMQNLASGVGDLKRVLTNVTTRGAWGEVQLENLLTQILAPEQFGRNVSPTGSGERVEFAIKLPGPNAGTPVWLPIDAKFPSETYQRLAAAAERCDAEGVEACSRELENVIRACAKTFSGKYLAPPHTTDFGILFLATEGLYAEALRRPGLAETLQRDYRVVLAGPTTFAALLNSLQMGFQTLTIQQRSGEVWKLLGDVKTQFGKYSQVLDLIRKRLDQATQTVDEASVRTRAIEKRLKNVDVEDSEDAEASNVIQLASAG
jgi:DNA recombination protein RmuC